MYHRDGFDLFFTCVSLIHGVELELVTVKSYLINNTYVDSIKTTICGDLSKIERSDCADIHSSSAGNIVIAKGQELCLYRVEKDFAVGGESRPVFDLSFISFGV